MLGGKAGVVHLHVGNGNRKLTPILQIVEETEIPIGQFLPTHLSRTLELLDHAIEFALRGGNIDFTVKGEDLNSPLSTEQAITQALHHGVSLSRITLSSDSNGSMPVFDKDGQMIRLGIGDICNLYRDVQVLIQKGFPLEDVLTMVTRNPAERLGLLPWKGTLETGKDTDLLILTQDLRIEAVMAKGKFLFQNGRVHSLSPFAIDS
ncbi:MAG: amidohydrolase family protein [Spirochaetales bacterium]